MYASKHAPWVAMQEPERGVQFSQFPADYTQLPAVSFVIPNMCNSMHDCSIATGDTWARNNLEGYRIWATTHNSLLVVTFDEDDALHSNLIYTTFNGANVKLGSSTTGDNLYSILGMIEDSQGLPRMAGSVGKPSMADVFTSAAAAPVTAG
jgi:phospholipase C